jgi:hypothetical protein
VSSVAIGVDADILYDRQISFPLCGYWVVEVLAPWVLPCCFCNCTNLHSHQQCSRVSFFPHPQNPFIFGICVITHICQGEMVSHYGFVLPWLLVMGSIFSCICYPFVCLFLRNVCLGLLPIFSNWVIWCFVIKFF